MVAIELARPAIGAIDRIGFSGVHDTSREGSGREVGLGGECLSITVCSIERQHLRRRDDFCMIVVSSQGDERPSGEVRTVTTRVGFLGAGKMATALAKGWLTAGLLANDSTLAS